jgi:dienelactone hydrolase
LRVASALTVAALGAVACLPATAAADLPGPQHNFPIVREGTAGLADHTVFRPADPSAPRFKLPIVAWGNGGCRNSNEEFRYFLTHFAPYGYFVVANGAPENPYRPEEVDGLADPKPEKLIAGIDWAVAQNEDPASPWHRRLDTTRIALMGQSCGGGEAIDASSDPRVRTTIAWNEGLHTNAAGVHAPILIASGGQDDFTQPYQDAAYEGLAPRVPAVRADHATAGHTGFWDDPPEGEPRPGPYQDEPLLVAQRWLELALYGRPSGRAFFLGDACGLCRRTPWTVESKNWELYPVEATEATEAPAVATAQEAPPSTAVAPVPATADRAASTAPQQRAVTVRPKLAIRNAGRVRRGASLIAIRLRAQGEALRRLTVTLRSGSRRVAVATTGAVPVRGNGRLVKLRPRRPLRAGTYTLSVGYVSASGATGTVTRALRVR